MIIRPTVIPAGLILVSTPVVPSCQIYVSEKQRGVDCMYMYHVGVLTYTNVIQAYR